MADPDRPRTHVEAVPSEEVGVGIYARTEDGTVLAAVNPDRPRPPASNTKLLTTALALDRLGPAHRFRLRAHHDDAGRLVLRGDRTLDVTTDDLGRLATTVADAGIDRLAGIVLDVADHDRQPYGPGWTWSDEERAYGARCSPIAVAGNVVTVDVIADVAGVTATATPGSPALTLEATAEVDSDAAPDGADLDAYRDHETGVVRVEGALPPGTDATVTAPIGDPLAHAGAVLAAELDARGVAVDGRVAVADDPADAPDGGEPVGVIESAPLADLCTRINRPSDNFMAEQLARAVAANEAGVDSWAAWQGIVDEALGTIGAGPARVRDGSGLSRYNRLAPRTIVQFLEWAQTRPWGETLIESLPVAGESGTLETRLGDRAATVRAKTGTLTGARALSGIIDRDGRRVTFSVLLGDLAGDHETAGHDYVDAIVVELLDVLGPDQP